ncbi:MAG: pantothenate kinase [Prochlorotrichaceae cyanobacterium]
MGNRHLHWGWVPPHARSAADLIFWDTPHLAAPFNALNLPDRFLRDPALLGSLSSRQLPLLYASVVPEQTDWLHSYPLTQFITLADIPLGPVYPTLGVDRALGLWAAGQFLGWPAIVVDGGTALTLTGGDGGGQFVGGAILPGLGLQFRSLFQHTAALPSLHLEALPDRWARNTPDAIRSGIAYTLLAGVQSFLEDWIQHYPQTHLCFTGGDGQWLYHQLSPRLSVTLPAGQITYNPHLALWGILRRVIN